MFFPLLPIKKIQKNKNSCITYSAPSSSFTILPNEIICRILTFLPTTELIPLYNIPSNMLRSMVENELVTRLEQQQLGIRLYFDQEARWRYTQDMKLSVLTKGTQRRLCFIPTTTNNNSGFKFYTSKLLRRPTLYKASLIATNEDLSSLPDNLLLISHPLAIKEIGSFDIQDGMFRYRVTSSNAPQLIKSRPGERWIHLCRFECNINLLCQTKSNFNKWLDRLHAQPTRRRMTRLDSTRAEKLPCMEGQIAELGITVPITVDKHYNTPLILPNIIS